MEEKTKKQKKSVKIRLRKEAEAEWKEENKGRLGAVTARLRNEPSSPRKMRLVADMIRGVRVSKALNLLKYEPKHASARLEKLLLSAISDWQTKNEDIKLEDADLYIKEIKVDSGRMLKRLRPAPQGRAHRIRKRSNHVMLVLDSFSSSQQDEETVSDKSKEEKDKEKKK